SPTATDLDLSPGSISAGTLVNSFTLHFDVVGTRPNKKALQALGSITFDQPILGIMVLSQSENDTNSMLGRAGVTYSNGSRHGLELNPGGTGSDFITCSDDLRTVFVDLHNA